MVRFLNIFIAVVCAVVMAGCGGQEKKWKIGVSQCSGDDWRVEMNEEIEREIMFHDDAEVEIRSADSDNDRQIADIHYFIDHGFDIIIAAPNEALPITPAIKEALDKGIPVVTFDRDADGDCHTAHIEADNMAIGMSAARYALNILPPHAKVIEIQGSPGMTPTIRRHQGFTEEMDRHPGIEIVASVYANWNYQLARHLTDSILEKHPDVDLIFSHSDSMAIAASEAARGKGKDHIRILGIDGIPHIGVKAVTDSIIDATFIYPTMGGQLVETALSILKGKPYERNVMVPPLSAIDKSNADIFLKQKALQKNEVKKIGLLHGKVNDMITLHSAQTTLLYSAVAIVVLLIAALSMFIRTIRLEKKHRNLLEKRNRQLSEQHARQKELYQQLDSATRSKLVFFTNVSHDLRTPLTLIEEPLAQIAENPSMPALRKETLMNMAVKNIKILKRLINQILDFRKYENGKMPLNLSEVDFSRMAEEWFESFSTVASRRHIRLSRHMEPDKELYVAVDVEKIERVFFNLMSNAFKYTPDNGEIHLDCRHDGESLIFSVSDTGSGIEAGDLPMIFERFYQVDKVHPNGSGIGLALTKAFVEMHGGEISVESTPGSGSVFTVTLPMRHVDNRWDGPAIMIRQKEIDDELQTDGMTLATHTIDTTRPTILIIDDNPDIRKLVCTLLMDEYNILTAANGKQGVGMATKYVPDLIICDVMMPVMDGMQCCRVIKNEVSTSHIPVLMLTACTLDEQRVQGYDSGADGYLPKPFNGKVLSARCRNLIENRKRINVATAMASQPDKKRRNAEVATDIDSDFYSDFLNVVNAEMGNPDLSIDYLAKKVGLGQSQFSRKIKALTNYTPVELLRALRLKKARTLLTSTEKTIGEIAFEVGFTSQAYFSKCFKDTYRETPSDMRERLSGNQ